MSRGLENACLGTEMTILAEGQRLGSYRIVRLIGEGGMGAVYEARQEPLDRRVALKTLHPEYARHKDAIARFFNEAKVLSRLEHPSIVQVSDFGTSEDGTVYLVMEFLRGQTLGSRLRDLGSRDERLPVLKALQLAFQIADVLAVAHAGGIVHRDIKPDNLMLVADALAPGSERVKLLDFGIAKLTHEQDKGGVKTATQAVMGTPRYMSPEQCAGAGGVDAKTDVYALGCVLFEMLAGRTPFIADGPGQLIGMHLFQPPPSLLSLAPKVPQSVADTVHRFLVKERDRRPSMSEAADELGKLLSKLTGGSGISVMRSRPPGSTDPDSPHLPVLPLGGTTLGRSIGQQASRSPRRTLLIGLGATATIALGAFLFMQSSLPAAPNTLAPVRGMAQPDLSTWPSAQAHDLASEPTLPPSDLAATPPVIPLDLSIREVTSPPFRNPPQGGSNAGTASTSAPTARPAAGGRAETVRSGAQPPAVARPSGTKRTPPLEPAKKDPAQDIGYEP
ncbi:MAG: protein kinase [Polyangia bacterium]